jgi:hypothetical protein
MEDESLTQPLGKAFSFPKNGGKKMFKNSIASYPDRGPYGKSGYRGNTTGYLIRDFLEFVHPDKTVLFCDPCEGGGTSGDTAAAMGIRYMGLDLKSGFDILKQDLGAQAGEPIGSVFFHPPYWGMVKYSDREEDLSNAANLKEFLEKVQLAAMNIYDALAPMGHYGILLGNWRRSGYFYPLASLVETIVPGKQREEIIKVQHRTSSSRKRYPAQDFVPIMHEKLLVFQKDRVIFSLDYAINLERCKKDLIDGTWRNLIRRVLMKRDGRATLDEVYESVEGTDKAKGNPNWKAKVRQILAQNKELFGRVSRGQYQLI